MRPYAQPALNPVGAFVYAIIYKLAESQCALTRNQPCTIIKGGTCQVK